MIITWLWGLHEQINTELTEGVLVILSREKLYHLGIKEPKQWKKHYYSINVF